jgi:PPOX class probable F420-dependent enzyme
MSAAIPDSHKDLLEGPVYVTLATVLSSGQPHLSVVWCGFDGEHVLINTARGRVKDKNMTARPQATVMAIDPQNPYRWIEVRADVAEATEEGGVDHIHELSRLYMGKNYYGDFAPAEAADKETRVIYKLKPNKVVAFGG